MSEAIQLMNLLLAICPSVAVYRLQLEAKVRLVRKLVGRAQS
jgi:hypothetical protein